MGFFYVQFAYLNYLCILDNIKHGHTEDKPLQIVCWRSALSHHRKLDVDRRWTIVKSCIEDLHCFIPEIWQGWLGGEPPCLILCVESVLCVFTEHLTWTSGRGPTPMRTQTRWRCPTSGASSTRRTIPSGSPSIQRTSLASSSSRLATWFQVRCHQRCGCCRICFQLLNTPQVLSLVLQVCSEEDSANASFIMTLWSDHCVVFCWLVDYVMIWVWFSGKMVVVLPHLVASIAML